MKQHIPSIHNFCDRWCERCTFTARCAVFAMEAGYTDEEKNIQSEAFWEKIGENMQAALTMLTEQMKEDGYLPVEMSAGEQAEIEAKMKIVELITDEEELIRVLTNYEKGLKKLLDDRPYWRSLAASYVKETQMEIRDQKKILADVTMISDCKEVLGWYMYFLRAKFRRAVSGQLDNYYDASDLQSDWNGSAKIALIGVERSRSALLKLFDLQGDEDRMLPLLSMLNKIEKLAKEKFPFAMEFIRPGFDEVNDPVEKLEQ